jgi:hypothetical protein
VGNKVGCGELAVAWERDARHRNQFADWDLRLAATLHRGWEFRLGGAESPGGNGRESH